MGNLEPFFSGWSCFAGYSAFGWGSYLFNQFLEDYILCSKSLEDGGRSRREEILGGFADFYDKKAIGISTQGRKGDERTS